MAGQSVRDIRRRISSVKNIQQITKAMEMVSAAKLRRAQQQVLSGRPFAEKLRDVLDRLTRSTAGRDTDDSPEHPLLDVRDARRVLYVLITADRGLAGGYNANMNRHFASIMEEETRLVDVLAMGSKGRDFLVKSDVQPIDEFVHLGDDIDYLTAQTIAGDLMEYFTSGTYDEVHLVYAQFVSAATQRPTSVLLLPLGADQATEAEASEEQADHAIDYIYEPNAEDVLDILLPRFVETEVYRIIMEAKASEHGARMTAMRNASDNADEMIDMLTLTYNRARQAGITKEIAEIVGGAEAIAAD